VKTIWWYETFFYDTSSSTLYDTFVQTDSYNH